MGGCDRGVSDGDREACSWADICTTIHDMQDFSTEQLQRSM